MWEAGGGERDVFHTKRHYLIFGVKERRGIDFVDKEVNSTSLETAA